MMKTKRPNPLTDTPHIFIAGVYRFYATSRRRNVVFKSIKKNIISPPD